MDPVPTSPRALLPPLQRGSREIIHVKCLPGCLTQSRALINESSDSRHLRICDNVTYSLPSSDGLGFSLGTTEGAVGVVGGTARGHGAVPPVFECDPCAACTSPMWEVISQTLTWS